MALLILKVDELRLNFKLDFSLSLNWLKSKERYIRYEHSFKVHDFDLTAVNDEMYSFNFLLIIWNRGRITTKLLEKIEKDRKRLNFF